MLAAGCAGQGTSSYTGCHNNKGKSQDTFESLGDVKSEGKNGALGIVDSETKSKQELKPKHLQTH